MRLVFPNEAYVLLDKEAKAKGKTTRQLGVEIILGWLETNKS